MVKKIIFFDLSIKMIFTEVLWRWEKTCMFFRFLSLQLQHGWSTELAVIFYLLRVSCYYSWFFPLLYVFVNYLIILFHISSTGMTLSLFNFYCGILSEGKIILIGRFKGKRVVLDLHWKSYFWYISIITILCVRFTYYLNFVTCIMFTIEMLNLESS